MSARSLTPPPPPPPRVLVVGDARLDWLIVKDASTPPTATFVKQRGGALLLADVYRRLAGYPDAGPDPVVTYDVCRSADGDRPLDANDEGQLRSHLRAIRPHEFPHAAVELDRYGPRRGEGKEADRVFRVRQQFEMREAGTPVASPPLVLGAHAGAPPFLALVDDIKLGFRDQAPPKALLDCEKVVVAAQWPVTARDGSGKVLWEALSSVRAAKGQVIVILNVSYLRAHGKEISRGLSWQKTLREMLAKFSRELASTEVIVRFGQEAAAHRLGNSTEWTFHYYPDRAEDHVKETHPGDMIGAHAVFAAAVGSALAERRLIRDGIREAITYASKWHEAGFGVKADQVGYPLSEIGRWKAKGADSAIQSVSIDQANTTGRLFLLNDTNGDEIDLDELARKIVVSGPKEIATLPRAVFSGVAWVDPREVETYRHVAALVGEYLKREAKRPLSIAVFGPPGSGKSFGVKMVAKALGDLFPLEFNVSQWDSATRLVTAFHKAREVSVTGGVPLVFFDEFDSTLGPQLLGWLRYFLAPMNDGKFRDADSEYSLGKTVFVFAGATSHTFREFRKKCRAPEARAAKAPDFLSRLRGHVDVLGPSPPRDDSADPLYVVRRALVLRDLLKNKGKSLFAGDDLRIHPEVLKLLLSANYQHGARSLEAVLDMCRIAGKPTFGLADLPPDEQLELHIEGRRVGPPHIAGPRRARAAARRVSRQKR